MLAQPYPPPAMPPAPPPRPEPLRQVGTLFLLMGVLLAILIFSGLLAMQATLILPVPSGMFGYPSTPSPQVTAYVSMVRTLTWASMILVDSAVALSVVLSFWIGSKGSEVSDATRRGLYLLSAVFLGSWLVISPFLLSFILATVRYYP